MSNTGDLPKYVQISELLAIPELCMLAEGARCQEEISAVGPVLACAGRGGRWATEPGPWPPVWRCNTAPLHVRP